MPILILAFHLGLYGLNQNEISNTIMGIIGSIIMQVFFIGDCKNLRKLDLRLRTLRVAVSYCPFRYVSLCKMVSLSSLTLVSPKHVS
jgi:hypothetical protein